MSQQLESALIIELADTIKWRASLAPLATDGSLAVVNPASALDITQYARRDRELSYRDITNATAIVRVALHMETVWNATAIRPGVQGITSGNLPYSPGDTGRVDSTVIHVNNSSLPLDALSTDKDLMGRDQLVYEVLVKACQIFTDPPLTTSGANIPGVTAWSQAEGVDYVVEPSPALPLNRDVFKKSDVTLTERDNLIAAYAANICQILRNPFAYATRLYVQIGGVDARDTEVYVLIRNYYQTGTIYDVGNQVFYQTGWYQAQVPTSNLPTTSDWIPISAPTERVWAAEPALPFRNRVIYNTSLQTVQWFRETTDIVQVPQLVALSVPGLFTGQTVSVVPGVPERKDAQFWKQKAARLSYSGTTATPIFSIPNTTGVNSGVIQTDTVGLTSPSILNVPFDAALQTGHRYRISALIKPSQSVEIFGAYNLFGVPGTNLGVDFVGIYQPTITTPGAPVSYNLVLPPGNWYATLEYTNITGSTAGFGIRVDINGVVVRDDAAPFLFQDSSGNPLPNGTLVTSDVIPFTATGSSQILSITCTYGVGVLSVRKLRLFSYDNQEGEYYFQAQVYNGTSVIQDISPTMESTGHQGVYEVAHFDFSAVADANNPVFSLTWSQTSELPIQFRQFSLSEVVQTFSTPGIEGFEAFKWECLRRAERSVQSSFTLHTQNTPNGTVPDFTVDGTNWTSISTDNWMSFIEVNEPRLRQISNVTSITGGRQYEVSGSYVVYNGGTYADESTFFGTSVVNFTPYYGATVDQLGAFKLSTPNDVGLPAVLPLGLSFSSSGTGAIVQLSDPVDQVPTLVSLQPWMVEAGLYTADGDFISPQIIATVNRSLNPVNPPLPPIPPGPLPSGLCPVVTSYPTIAATTNTPYKIAAFDAARRVWWVSFSGFAPNGFHTAPYTYMHLFDTKNLAWLPDATDSFSLIDDRFKGDTSSGINMNIDTTYSQAVLSNTGGYFTWYDLNTKDVLAVVQLTLHGSIGSGSQTYDPHRGYIYQVGNGGGAIAIDVVDCNPSVRSTIGLYTSAGGLSCGNCAFYAAPNPTNDRIFIANASGTALYHTFDPNTNLFNPNIGSGGPATSLAFFPTINVVAITTASQTVFIDAATGSTLGTNVSSSLITGSAYDSCKNLLYITNYGFSNVLVYFDPSSSYAATQVPASYTAIAFDPYANYVFAVDTDDYSIRTT